MMQMLCPKCQNPMHQYERNGVVVEQCSECKGIFLDRGELEHLMNAEANYQRGAAVAPPAAPSREPRYDDRRSDDRRDDRRYDDRRRDDHYDDRRRSDDYHYKKKKRKSVFEDLFDF